MTYTRSSSNPLFPKLRFDGGRQVLKRRPVAAQLGIVAATRVPRSVLLAINRSPRLKAVLRRGARLVRPTGDPVALREIVLKAGPLKGYTLELDPRSYDWTIELNAYEPWVHKVLVEHVRLSTVVWEVGAYIGYYVLLLRRVAPSAHVVAFEPDPDNIARLHKNLVTNRVSDVTVIPMAVSATGEDLPFLSAGAWSLSSPEGAKSVKSVTLDSAATELGSPSLVLMDIEGGEATALDGGRRLLEEVRPTWIVELHGEAGLAAYQRFVNAGYEIAAADSRRPIPLQIRQYNRVHILATARRDQIR